MSDFGMLAIAGGVVGNLATGVVQAWLRDLESSHLKSALSKIGILEPEFEELLARCLKAGVANFLKANPKYQLSFVGDFLNDKRTVEEIAAAILEMRAIDRSALVTRLSHYSGVPISEAPEGWPNQIDPEELVARLESSISYAIAQSDSPAAALLASIAGETNRKLEAISSVIMDVDTNISRLREDLASNSESDKHHVFENRFKNHVIARAGKLTTPGARDLHGVNQNLSLAYISLHLTTGGAAAGIPAEDFLIENPLLCIRGPAGSGKTTLLNWLATRCDAAQGSESWASYVPFVLPLRTIARLESGPPRVVNFVTYSTDQDIWSATTPDGWVEDVLNERRAIVMIDGVDELPAARRTAFWEWLDNFSREYEGNRIIVTSRVLPGSGMPGSSAGWSPPAHFADTMLMEMSDSDISQFIAHWHDAVDRSRLEPADITRLTAAKESLPDKLRDPANRRIRGLCSTPLLNAMVCVLHWREEGYLPKYRVDLYEKCCEMLIEARDLKRNIALPDGALGALTRHDKEMLLQRLAFEMMQNAPDGDDDDNTSYRVEVRRAKAVDWIANRISSFQSEAARTADPVDVLNYLIERTGLLREPAGGLIDFPHRTFQEYLAACAAGAESKEGLLAKLARDDQWHETIMLAAGTTTGGVPFGRRLIEALLKRAERHSGKTENSRLERKTCWALALGCLENLRQQDPLLRDRVLGQIENLVPPQNDADAKILAVAGEAAVPHLTYERFKAEPTLTVKACARALRLIGTAGAIESLRNGYRSDVRDAVLSEVCATQAIPFVEIPSVADHVKANGSLPHFAKAKNLELLTGLEGLVHLTIEEGYENPEVIHHLTGIDRVSVEGVSGSEFAAMMPLDKLKSAMFSRSDPGDMSWLRDGRQLESIVFINAAAPIDVSAVSGLQSLKAFNAFSCELNNVGAFAGANDLQSLTLSGCSISGAESMEVMKALTHIDVERIKPAGAANTVVDSCERLEDVRVAGLPNLAGKMEWSRFPLKKLEIIADQGMKNLESLRGQSQLVSMTLAQASKLKSLDGIDDLSALENLTLSDCEIDSVEKISELSALRSLRLIELRRIATLPDLSALNLLESLELMMLPRLMSVRSSASELRRLSLMYLPNLADISWVAESHNLGEIEITDCMGLEDLSPLSYLPKLERLSLREIRSPIDLRSISSSKSLRSIEIMFVGRGVDGSALAEIESLEEIRLLESDVERVKIPAQLAKITRIVSDGFPPFRYHGNRFYPMNEYIRRY